MKRNFVLIILFFFTINLFSRDRETVKFVQLTDTQLGMGGYEHDKQSFQKAVIKINEINPDFVLICGDLVNTANDTSYTAFKKIIKELKVPYYCVPGNHDVGSNPDQKSLAYYRKTIGRDYYRFNTKKFVFIAVNTQLWKVKVEEESHKHDLWVKKTLRKSVKKNKRIIVFGHIPLFVSEPEEKEAYFNFSPEKRKELLNLFEANSVAAYLSGHSHTLIIKEHNGIQLVSGETTSRNFDNRPIGFRFWTLSADSVNHRLILLE